MTTASEKIYRYTDKNSFRPFPFESHISDPLHFPGYHEKVRRLSERTGRSDAVITGCCKIEGESAVLVVFNSEFMMGTMGMVEGEKVCHAFETATKRGHPVILLLSSGGARMQEGLFSLVQMVNTVNALSEHHRAGLFSVSVISNPTLGGVSASFAGLTDLVIAEPDAVYGFAGRRVVEDTMRKKAGEHFQTAAEVMQNGFLDMVVAPDKVRQTLGVLLRMYKREL